jgi:hypothetical protein
MADANSETIARHLRELGLTEEQIQRHVAPLIAKEARPNPPKRKLGRPSIVERHFFTFGRKPAYHQG